MRVGATAARGGGAEEPARRHGGVARSRERAAEVRAGETAARGGGGSAGIGTRGDGVRMRRERERGRCERREAS